jgi:hypothetical protein
MIITFLVGFVASAITGGAPMVLLILMTLLAAGLLVWTSLDLSLKLPKTQLSHLWRQPEISAPNVPREVFVLGVGHRVNR